MKKTKKHLIMSLILTCMMIISLAIMPMSEVNAASKTSNLKKLCKAIKRKNIKMDGKYFVLSDYEELDETAIITRINNKKIKYLFSHGNSDEDFQTFVSFAFSSSTNKLKIRVSCSYYTIYETINIKTYSDKRSQIKISSIKLYRNITKSLAKKHAALTTQMAIYAFESCIYEFSGLNLNKLGFKKYNSMF